MDDFYVFGDSFQESLKNLEKVLLHCQEACPALSEKNCRLMCKVEVVLAHLISDSQWVSPLVLEPKKDGIWHFCIEYRELNKATLKD